jgi:hypothetical protein
MIRQKPPLPSAAALQSLEPEEALVRIHQSLAPEAKKLRLAQFPWRGIAVLWGVLNVVLLLVMQADRSGQLSWLAALLSIFWGVFVVLFPLFLLLIKFYNRPREKRVEAIVETLRAPLEQCRTTEVLGELLDLLVWLEPASSADQTRHLHETLGRLLPRVGEQELEGLLTPERRKILRALCKRLTTRPDLVASALLVLGSVHDRETVPIARRLVRQRRAVADAAEAFLDAVR